jgi:hypothetical protein
MREETVARLGHGVAAAVFVAATLSCAGGTLGSLDPSAYQQRAVGVPSIGATDRDYEVYLRRVTGVLGVLGIDFQIVG